QAGQEIARRACHHHCPRLARPRGRARGHLDRLAGGNRRRRGESRRRTREEVPALLEMEREDERRRAGPGSRRALRSGTIELSGMTPQKKYAIFGIITAVTIAIDQWSKWWARSGALDRIREVVPGYWEFTLSHNTRGAFGFNIPGGRWAFVVF